MTKNGIHSVLALIFLSKSMVGVIRFNKTAKHSPINETKTNLNPHNF